VLWHLRLVTARRDGRRMHYRLHDHHIEDLLGAIRHQLEHAERGWSEGLAHAIEDGPNV
jgi:DNA-binding transcriptional ArsR family regulator